MNVRPFIALLCLAAGAPAQDTVHFKDGTVETGLVTELAGPFLVLRPAPPATALRRLDTATIATVRFGQRPEMDRARATEGNERLELLRRLWYLLRPSIGLPESPAGDWGLLFASAILNSDLPDHVKLSFEVFKTIEENDWNRERRHAARRGRFNAMLNLGLIEEAMAEARQVASDPSQEDPELLILARMMLGDLAFRQLKDLEKEHPRWDLDDDVRPQRNALRDTALDHYLFAHLYHGDAPEAAARGLWAAIQVMQHGGDQAAAANRAYDLTLLYPSTPEAAQAAPLAKTRPPESPDDGDGEVDAEEENIPAGNGDGPEMSDPDAGKSTPADAPKSKSTRKKKSSPVQDPES